MHINKVINNHYVSGTSSHKITHFSIKNTNGDSSSPLMGSDGVIISPFWTIRDVVSLWHNPRGRKGGEPIKKRSG